MADAELMLYSDARNTSPWVLSVWTALVEKGLDFGVHTLDLEAGGHRRDEYVRRVPTAKVPALRHRGRWIAESLAILEYLEEAFPDRTPLLPRDPLARARDRTVLSWLRSDLFELRRCLPFEGLFLPVDPPAPSPQARAEAEKLLRVVDARLAEGGPGGPTLADLDLAFTLRRLVHYRWDLAGHAGALALAEAVWQRPAVRAWIARPRPSLASG